MKLGPLNVDSPYFLAPMAGYTDKPFRYICKTFGAGLTVSELISVNAVYYGNSKTLRLMDKNEIEKPFSIQLFGFESDIFLYAAQRVEEFCDCIDINAGCPAPKVVKAKAGSYLLREKKRLFEIIDKLKKHIKKPISVKLRKGFDKCTINDVHFYRELENRGVDFIILHPRLRSQFFKGDVDYLHAAEVVDCLNIDVVVNGGIDSLEKLNYVKKITSGEFFMIGQVALGKPYIFEDFIKSRQSIKSIDFVKDLMRNHFLLMNGYYGEYIAVRNFRKFFHSYVRGFEHIKHLKEQINLCKNSKEVIEIIDRVS